MSNPSKMNSRKSKRKKLALRFVLKRYSRIFLNTLWNDNPICRMVLGICSTLAVTNRLANAVAMGLGVTFAMAVSSVSISLIRNLVPRRVRMIVYMIVISTAVILVDRYLKAYFPEISEAMGPYVGLIITNCIIMGRAESYASVNKPMASFIDALGAGAGYTFALLVIATVRELLGFGSIFNIKVLGPDWTSWVIMIMAPGAFLVLGVFIWVIRSIQKSYDATP
ncbi:MAG: electron transport complex subunit RsxE [Omnitrophica bacterium]|nr:electron transport complex subunit RsxE [Candidatus Omnitrophota bacterium]